MTSPRTDRIGTVGVTYNFTPYVVAGLLFVALAVPSARLADWASRRVAIRQGAL